MPEREENISFLSLRERGNTEWVLKDGEQETFLWGSPPRLTGTERGESAKNQELSDTGELMSVKEKEGNTFDRNRMAESSLFKS